MHTHSLREQISSHLNLPEFDLHLSELWASTQPDYRSRLRAHLHARFDRDPSILDLTLLPKPVSTEISISHNRGIGGYASAQGVRIGFDIERTDRLQGENIRRISVDEKEFTTAPTRAALWTAKEAAFKALGPGCQPRAFKRIEVGEWRELEKDGYACQIKSIEGRSYPHASQGVTLIWGEYTVAVFTLPKIQSAVVMEDECVGY